MPPVEVTTPCRPIRILGISGSLRVASSNTALIRAAVNLTPECVEVRPYSRLEELPAFNPDLEGDTPPPAVAFFRGELLASDAVLISSPEYAHGVPGALKNALDWLVGSGELVGKPVALINASPRATHAPASLAETLRVMTAKLVNEASITIPLSGRSLDAQGLLADAQLSSALSSALAALVRAVETSEA